jgi:arylsulfatase A-like enzyme
MPTVFDYIGKSYPKQVQGKSFLNVLKGKKETHRDVIFSEVGRVETPPPTIPRDKYKAYSEKRAKDEGMFWFIDYTTKGRSVMIRKGDWKYNFYTGDINELYNLKVDPLELNNLIDKPKYAAIQKELNTQLIEWLLVAPVENIR